MRRFTSLLTLLALALGLPGLASAQYEPRVLVIFDTSGSMLWDYQGEGDCWGDGSVRFPHRNGCDIGSKMFHAKAALSEIIGEAADVEFGLMRYGQLEPGDAGFGDLQSLVGAQYRDAGGNIQSINYDGSTNGCGPADSLVDPTNMSNEDVMLWLDGRESYPADPELRANGYTPLTWSMASARQALVELISEDANASCRPYFVLLLTDGFQQCPGAQTQERDVVATELFTRTLGLRNLSVMGESHDVRTFVVGFGRGTAFVTELDAMARAGGTAVNAQGDLDLFNGTAYQANDPEGLVAALQGAIGNAQLRELCDGIDNDCDGQVDEDFPLLGQGCSVGQGLCARSGVGVCADNGEGVECSVEPFPGNPEQCDDLDNDCDGRTDEGVRNRCDQCGPEPTEICNGQDDDCDGAADEGTRNACGQCGPLPREVCNNADDDCDGRTDEGTRNACGACGATPVEVCNCEDDDCDNRIDEGLNCGRDCNCDPAAGGEICNGRDDDCDLEIDEGSLNRCGQCGPEPVEICNGLDDDCDGNLDEGFPNQNMACGTDEGLCEAGIWRCVDGQEICVGALDPMAEICDGQDNDCDGQADEDAFNTCGYCGTIPADVCDNIDNDCDSTLDEDPQCPTGLGCVNGECSPGCEMGECFGNRVCVEDRCVTPCYNTDCPTGWVCQDGECADPCGDIQCPTGTYCTLGECVADDCYNMLGDAACDPGEVCDNGACVPDACALANCPEGVGCIDGECYPDECRTHTDCPEGLACVNGRCADDPCARVTCSFPSVCQNGQCVADPCFEVPCPTGHICVEGACVDDPCLSMVCPEGMECHRGRCQGGGGENLGPRPDAGLTPPDAGGLGGGDAEPLSPADASRITGANGCDCQTNRSGPFGGLGLILIALMGIMRRRR